jgi:hypothetical protein
MRKREGTSGVIAIKIASYDKAKEVSYYNDQAKLSLLSHSIS